MFAMMVLIILSTISISGVLTAYAYFTRDLPEFNVLVANWEQSPLSSFEASTIYAWKDKEQKIPVPIYEITAPLSDEVQWQTSNQLPQTLLDATIASEDPDFWQDEGINTAVILRKLISFSRRTDQTIGESTLILNIVRQNLIDANRSVVGDRLSLANYGDKLEELLLAHRVSNSYTKDQILEWYLNTAFYGNLAYGVDAAARVYFNKSPTDLTLAESAMLAAVPRAPHLNPFDNFDEAKQRQVQVLEAMAEAGMIGRETMATAQFSPLAVAPGLEERFDIIAPHFSYYVRQELEARLGSETLLKGGLQIYTTLNLEIQQQAECLARAHINRLSGNIGPELPADERNSCFALEFLPSLPASDIGLDFNVNNAAIIVMDAETSGLKAMVGSLKYWDKEINGAFNMAVNGQRQPGTAIKPFIYLTALSQGYTAATMTLDVETGFTNDPEGIPFIPTNIDDQYHGPMRLRQALGNGYNVPAIQVMSWVGADKVLRTAHSLGITGLEQKPNDYDLSLALGGGHVTLLDMVYAYNVINNMGVMLGQTRIALRSLANERTLDPVTIFRVEDGNGDIIYEYSRPQRREILTPQLAYLMNDMMSDRSARCNAFGCPNVMELPLNRPAAVTTGNTNDWRDAWTIGYTPQLITGVWVGNSDNRDMNQLSGVQGAAPIWHALMSWILQDEPVAVWTQPPDLVELAVCNISGLLSTPYCPTVSELFIAGTQPTVQDSIYQEFAINRENGRLATIYTPPELVEHKIFKVYPEQAAAWADENNVERPPTEYDTINTDLGSKGDAVISWPTPFTYINSSIEITGTASGENFDYYRLAYFKGLTPANLQEITNNEREAKESELLGNWDVSNLNGLYTLLLTVIREEGSFVEVSVPVTVDNIPPSISIISPRSNQEIATDSERVTFLTEVDDNISVTQVSFYLDDADAPFATSVAQPFTAQWSIRGAGCHTFMAIATDVAGNETPTTAVPVCFFNR